MMGDPSPRTPEGLQQGLDSAESASDNAVGQICEECGDNWVEVGAIDESTGTPLPNLPYKVFDVETKQEVASGVLDANGEGQRHKIPVPNTQLFVVFGTDEAIAEAMVKMEEMETQQALQANAVSEWRGFESGLTKEEFSQQHRTRTQNGDFVDADRGWLGGAASGVQSLADLTISAVTLSNPIENEYRRRRDDAWEQYQLATGARVAGAGESFGGGAAQGVTFGFDDEIGAMLGSLFDDRSYEELVDAYRHTAQQRRISNPGWFIGGEIAGALPTIFIPVGGAAATGARAAGTTGRAVVQGAKSAAPIGAAFGALAGAGHDTGGVADRLDGAIIGALTGGVAAAVLGGAGVLIARGISKTRIWARIFRHPPQRKPFHRQNLDDMWYRLDDGELRWPPNDGFSSPPSRTTIGRNTLIDRYSGGPPQTDGGKYFSPAGASFESRALPYDEAAQTLTRYQVVKPFEALEGSAAPWFDQAGGAMQYMTEMSTKDLLRNGFIRVVP
jgi:hypothetical protein